MGPEAQALFNGVLVAVLILREVVPMVKKKHNGTSGDRPVEYWLLEFRRIVREELRHASDDRRFRDEWTTRDGS